MDYEEVKHLPHIISYSCSGANLVTAYLEVLFGRPGAFFPFEGGEYDQSKRVTLLDKEWTDFLWVHLPHTGQVNGTSLRRRGDLYIYRDPVATLYAWKEFYPEAWLNPHVPAISAMMLRDHLHRHLIMSPAQENLRLEDWLDNRPMQADRIAKIFKPDYVFDPGVNLPDVRQVSLDERARLNNAYTHEYFGGIGPSLDSPNGRLFERAHGEIIRRIIFTEALKPFFNL